MSCSHLLSPSPDLSQISPRSLPDLSQILSLLLSLSLSPSRSIDSSVGRITLLLPEGLEFDPGLGHNWVGYEQIFTSKSAEESQT